MNYRQLLKVLSVLLVFVVFFGVAQTASADLKATNVFYALSDDSPPQYRNSLVKMELDGEPTHAIHELDFDNDNFYYNDVVGDPNNLPTVYAMCQEVEAGGGTPCPTDLNVNPDIYLKWAGVMELGIPHQDVGNGAIAFVSSASWSLIDCDLDGDDDIDNDDLDVDTRVNPPLFLTPWLGDPVNFQVLLVDDPRTCGNNTCAIEKVTTIFLDLDINDNGVLDQCPIGTDPNTVIGTACEIPASGGVCFFAELVPDVYTPGDPVWTGNPQARITAGGGDKTVNFNLLGPTAITLENLVAQSPGGIHPAIWLAIFVLLAGIAFVLIRESRQARHVDIRS